MNERAAPPTAPRPPRGPTANLPAPTGVAGRDREFLPAALEILETPTPPAPVALMMTICAFVLATLVWSFFGRLDVHAVAPGKIEVLGHAKVIQPLDPGRVSAIHVEEGALVKAGDLLLEFDPAEALADEATATDDMNASLAEVARRKFAIDRVRAILPPQESAADAPTPDGRLVQLMAIAAASDRAIRFDESIPDSIRMRERSVLSAELTQLSDGLADLDHQMTQKRATRQRLNMSIAFQVGLIQTMTQHVSTRQQAIDLQVGTKINLYDAKEQLQKSQSSLASDQGQLIEVDAALKELQGQKTKALSQFIADNENKASEAARKTDDARQRRAKAEAKLARTRLYAPIDGVAQQLAVTTIGQVVTTGQQLMLITPRGGRLQVEALVANLDIGFVRLGQDAAIKVDAFPFTRFGVLHGTVVSIASEAVDEQAAKRVMANAISGANPAGGQPSGAPGQPGVFVFPVRIELGETAIRAGDALIEVSPGMTVTAEIRTENRRVIDYFLSPLRKLASESLKEQ
jgi:hemolysin D